MSTPQASSPLNNMFRADKSSRSSFTNNSECRSSLRRSFHLPKMSKQSRRVTQNWCMHMDIVGYLPKELSLSILGSLPPVDLCRATLVCKRWHTLVQDRFLLRKRLRYIEAERAAWQRDAENRAILATPGQQNSLPHPRSMISGTTPLGVIQYASISQKRTSVTSPIANYLQTPTKIFDSMTDLQQGLKEEMDGAVRRCLFPDDLPTNETERPKKPVKSSKKHNKSRLKRL